MNRMLRATLSTRTDRFAIDLEETTTTVGRIARALDRLQREVSTTLGAVDAALTVLAADQDVCRALESVAEDRRHSGQGSITLCGGLVDATNEALVAYLSADEQMAANARGSEASAFDPRRFGSSLTWN